MPTGSMCGFWGLVAVGMALVAYFVPLTGPSSLSLWLLCMPHLPLRLPIWGPRHSRPIGLLLLSRVASRSLWHPSSARYQQLLVYRRHYRPSRRGCLCLLALGCSLMGCPVLPRQLSADAASGAESNTCSEPPRGPCAS